MDGFPAAIVERVAHVSSFDTLDYWCTSGLVTASATPPGGRRRFTFADIVVVKVVVSLRESGVSLQAIRKVSQRLQEAHGVNLARSRLVVCGDDVLLVDADELVSVLRQPGQVAMRMIIDLGRVEAEVKREVEKLAA